MEDILKKEISDLLGKKNLFTNKKLTYKNKSILVISGGGTKGLAALGALKALDDLELLNNINEFAGVSIGSLICSLLNINYKTYEIYEIFSQLDFNKMKNIDFPSLFTKFGVDNGDILKLILHKLFNGKNIPTDVTFKQLFELTNKKLIIVATCINTKTPFYMSVDSTPNLSVITSICMSCAVPFYFVPIEYEGKLYIDGGCIDNYPIHLYENQLDNVIGIYLASIRDKAEKISNLEDFIYNTLESFYECISLRCVLGYEKYTFKIFISNTQFLNLEMTLPEKQQLFNIGYNNILDFFT
jgi:NTE family protein